MRVYFIIPGSLDQTTGGTIYDKNIIQNLVEICEFKIHVKEIRDNYPFINLRHKKKVAEWLKNLDHDDIIIIDGLATMFFSDQIMQCKSILLLHNPLSMGGSFNSKQHQLLLDTEEKLVRNVDYVVCTSKFTQQFIFDNNLVPSLVISVVYPGKPQIKNNKKTIRSDTIKLLCVSKISKHKGIVDLIEALPHINCERPYQLDIVGPIIDTSYKKMLDEKIKQYDIIDKVEFHGFQDDLAPFYLSSDMFILPSHRESFGMVLLEAMGYSIPIIASNAGGIPETIKNGGILYPCGDYIELSKEISALICDKELRKNYASKANERFDDFNTWENRAERFKEIILNLVDGVY